VRKLLEAQFDRLVKGTLRPEEVQLKEEEEEDLKNLIARFSARIATTPCS
jgi:hypothetical protein